MVQTRTRKRAVELDERTSGLEWQDDPSYENTESKSVRKKRSRKTGKVQPTGQDINEELNSLRKKIADLEKEGRKLQAEKTALARESVLNSRRGTTALWVQAEIEAKFRDLKKLIASWIKKYMSNKPIDNLSFKEKKDILSACESDVFRGVFYERDFPKIQEIPRATRLLLEGFLFAQGVRLLVERPFIFLDAILHSETRLSSSLVGYREHEAYFTEFAQDLAECDASKNYPDQSQRWTASMLQSLKTIIIPDYSESVMYRQRQERANDSSLRTYELGISYLASNFLTHAKPVKHLLKESLSKQDHEKRSEELKDIYRKFRELAYHMWCQPSTLRIHYSEDRFNMDSMEIDFAALHGRPDDEMDWLVHSKVLINLNPEISGEVFGFNDTAGQITANRCFLKQRVWTDECQTLAQWKALEKNDSLAETKSRNRDSEEHIADGRSSQSGQQINASIVDKDSQLGITTNFDHEVEDFDDEGTKVTLSNSMGQGDNIEEHESISPHSNDGGDVVPDQDSNETNEDSTQATECPPSPQVCVPPYDSTIAFSSSTSGALV